MWYTLGYANTFICTPAHGGRAGNPGDRSPVRVRLYRTPLPTPARQCRGPGHHHDGPQPALHRADGAQCAPCVPPARARRAAAPIVPPPYYRDHLRRGHLRGFWRTVAFSSVGQSVTHCIPATRFLDFAPKIKLCDIYGPAPRCQGGLKRKNTCRNRCRHISDLIMKIACIFGP